MKQNNYLVIGLGGTGCAVVRELKKKMYVEWRKENTGRYPEVYRFKDDFGGETCEARIATLSIDSNAADLDGEGEKDEAWNVFGEILRLNDTEKVLLDPSGVDAILNNVDSYPGVSPWIKADIDFVREMTKGTSGPSGCNQIRRMGRLAFANGNGVDNVLSGVKNRIAKLSEGGGFKDVEIHIACTLGCGTGSGTLVDIVAQIQKELVTHTGKTKVYLHTFATSSDVGSANTGNFYANQYAALQELNAFRLNIYQPWDITVSQGQEKQRLSASDSANSSLSKLQGTFNSCAIITDTTEGGRQVGLKDQVENVAEFLYQLSVSQLGNIPKEIRDALSLEDRSQYPADTQGGDRATCFMSYGVQKLAIPEKEIKEKLAYCMGRQFLLKTIYNHYDDRYLDLITETYSVDAFVRKRRELWDSTRDYLNLDVQPEMEAEDSHARFKEDWNNRLNKIEAQVRKSLSAGKDDRKKWLSDMDRRAKDFWDAGFRGRGGIDYFNVKSESRSVRQHAKSIRKAIERDLIQGFERMDKEYPAHYFPEIIAYLIQEIEKERLHFSELVETSKKKATDAFDFKRASIAPEYRKIGIFAMGKVDRLFATYREKTVEYYLNKTLEKSADYAFKLTERLLKELKEFKEEAEQFVMRLKLLASDFETEEQQRIPEGEFEQKRDDVVYLVDAEHINSVISKSFVADLSVQTRLAENVMKSLALLRGDRMQFSEYNKKMPVDENNHVNGPFLKTLRVEVENQSAEAHVKLKEDDDQFDGIFGQNIMAKLYKDYGGNVDGDLKNTFGQLINDAMPMAAFDANQEPMGVPSPGPVLRRCVFVPQWKECPDEFDSELKTVISSIKGGTGSCKDVETSFESIPEERNPTEIVILAVAFFFPARLTQVVRGLKREYIRRTTGNDATAAARGYFQVTTESHNPPLPDLMKLGQTEVRKQKLPTVLLAVALGLDHVTDSGDLLFGHMDNVGRLQDRVESGLSVTAEDIKKAKDSSLENLAIESSLAALVDHYIRDFKDSCMIDLSHLVETTIRDGVSVKDVKDRLDDISGKSFLLRGKMENDDTYNLFNNRVEAAKELLMRLEA